jgi:hypothetical protein
MNASASPRKRRKKPARKVGLFSWRYLLPAGFFVVLAVFLLLGLGRNPNEIPSPLIGKEAPAFELPRLAGVAAPVKATEAGKASGNAPAGSQAAGTQAAGTQTAQTPAAGDTQPAASKAPQTPDTSANGTNGTNGTNSISSASLSGKPYLLNVWASWCMPCLQEHPQMMALAQRHRIRMVGMNYKDRPEDARRWLAHNGNPFDEIMVDAQGRTAIDFGVYGVPETFLIDGEGRIRRKIVGAISIETLQNELLPAIEKLEVEAK